MKTTLVDVSVANCEVSAFNTRKTKDEKHIATLVKSIQRGYDRTRAVKGVMVGDTAQIFAGGSRLEACKRLGLETIPAWLYEGLTDEDVARLETEDNEQDGGHSAPSLLDVWAEYYRLNKELGWSVATISEVKRCDESWTRKRIRMHTELPKNCTVAVGNGVLDEGHVEPLIEVTSDVAQLEVWLSSKKARDELTKEVLDKYTKPTVSQVREAAKRWKTMISTAQEVYASLPETAQRVFVDELVATKARSLPAVESARGKAVKHLEQAKEAARRAAQEAEARAKAASEAAYQEQLEVQRQAEEHARVAAFLAKCPCGDARELVEQAPNGIKLVLSDPPYGVAFQSLRKKASKDKPTIANDEDIETATMLLEEVLKKLYDKMLPQSAWLLFGASDDKKRFKFLEAAERVGFEYKTTIIWVKPGHGLPIANKYPAPKHEPILYLTKGSPDIQKMFDSAIMSEAKSESEHPHEKPLDLLITLIEGTTQPGDLVVDPFCGSGSTLLAAHKTRRDFWGCECELRWHEYITSKLLEIAKKEAA